MNQETRLEGIKRRCEAATPGTWERRQGLYHDHQVAARRVGKNPIIVVGSTFDRDAEFIAHARQDIPTLVREYERLIDGLALMAKRDNMESILDDIDTLLHTCWPVEP